MVGLERLAIGQMRAPNPLDAPTQTPKAGNPMKRNKPITGDDLKRATAARDNTNWDAATAAKMLKLDPDWVRSFWAEKGR